MKKFQSFLFLLALLFSIQSWGQRKELSDSALLDKVQQQTFRYFWDFAHPVSGMARERSNTDGPYGHETIAVGGTGFGIMSLIVAVERKWIERDTAARLLLKMVKFLVKSPSYHGAFPHWLDGATGRTIPFSRKDDGGDLVETSYLMQGLLCARQYFNRDNEVEKGFRNRVAWLWGDIEWNWYTQGQDVLYWHWSPNNGWAMNFPVRGFNECLIMYILAASSPNERYRVNSSVYHQGWAQSDFFRNGKEFYGIKLPLGFDYGGPLFFSHYSFLGL
ncbi:MAG TPA: glucoamylase family protein, partial [Chitinophagaceae bacterium]|nr:glucoamylase family protein [Chitinophagaceae bacterium]